MKKKLNPSQAAKELGVTLGSLKTMRSRGDGPKFFKEKAKDTGHMVVKYYLEDVKAYKKQLESAPERVWKTRRKKYGKSGRPK